MAYTVANAITFDTFQSAAKLANLETVTLHAKQLDVNLVKQILAQIPRVDRRLVHSLFFRPEIFARKVGTYSPSDRALGGLDRKFASGENGLARRGAFPSPPYAKNHDSLPLDARILMLTVRPAERPCVPRAARKYKLDASLLSCMKLNV